MFWVRGWDFHPLGFISSSILFTQANCRDLVTISQSGSSRLPLSFGSISVSLLIEIEILPKQNLFI